MIVYLGADHRGFQLKEDLKKWLTDEKYDVVDCGNSSFEPFDDAVDFAKEVSDKMLLNPHIRQYTDRSEALGILLCGSGIAISIAMNRRKYIRCALAVNPLQIRHGVENDHINAIALPAEHISIDEAKEIIRSFLTSQPLPDDKYIRRIGKLDM